MKLKIRNYFYYNNYSVEEELNGPIWVACCRDSASKFHLVQVFDKEELAPEFYIPYEEVDIARRSTSEFGAKVFEDSPNSIWAEKTARIETTFPWQVGKMRNLFTHTYQADVKYAKLVVQKLGLNSPYIEVPDDYKWRWIKASEIKELPEEDHFVVEDIICYWDIETDNRKLQGTWGGWKEAQECPIVNIGAFDSYEKSYYSFLWHPSLSSETFLHHYHKRNGKKYPVYYMNYHSEVEMLVGFFNFLGERRFDGIFGFNSEGGWRLTSKKGNSKKRWFDGFDCPYLYERAKTLGLLGEIQEISPAPNYKEFNRYFGVYMRSNGGKNQVEIRGLAQLDFIPIEATFKYEQKYHTFKGYSLNDYMKFFLGFGKVEHKRRLWELWDNDREKLRHYNIVDVEGCYLLDKKFGMTKDIFSLAEVVVAPTEDSLLGSKLYDHDTLKTYRGKVLFDSKYQKNFKRKNKHGKEVISGKFYITMDDLRDRETGKVPKSLSNIKMRGGYVVDVEPGIYYNIGTLDFTKFYPNAIISSNAGIMTAIDLKKEYWFCVTDMDGRVWDRKNLIETPISYFRKDINSINRTKFSKWIDKRVSLQRKADKFLAKNKDVSSDEWKLINSKQYAIKPYTNIGFGIFGLPSDRLFNKLSFNSCTIMCRDLTKMIIGVCEKKLMVNVIGGDTDSIFLELRSSSLSEQVEELIGYASYINEEISSYLSRVYNIQDHTIRLKAENVADKFFYHEKKNYVKRNLWKDGTFLDKPELDIKGLMLIKRNSSIVGHDIQLELLNVLMEEPSIEEGFKEVVKKFHDELTGKPFSYLCPRASINKKIEDYPPSNRSRIGAENASKILGKSFVPGNNPFIGTFSYDFTLDGKRFASSCEKLSFEEEDEEFLLEHDFKLDYDEVERSELKLKAEPFLRLVGLDYDKIIAQTRTSSFMLL